MKKIRSLSKAKIDEISALIGESFWDYPYEEGEGGLKPFFPSKEAMTEYMKSFVIAGIESGTFYCTDNGEGYILGRVDTIIMRRFLSRISTQTRR